MNKEAGWFVGFILGMFMLVVCGQLIAAGVISAITLLMVWLGK